MIDLQALKAAAQQRLMMQREAQRERDNAALGDLMGAPVQQAPQMAPQAPPAPQPQMPMQPPIAPPVPQQPQIDPSLLERFIAWQQGGFGMPRIGGDGMGMNPATREGLMMSEDMR